MKAMQPGEGTAFKRPRWLLGGLALAAAALALVPLGRGGAAPSDNASRVAESENVNRDDRELTRTQAAALVQKRYGARVVRTSSSTDEGGRRVYVFRLLSEGGKVWTVRIDAHSGAEVP
jgi:hypothetical protein